MWFIPYDYEDYNNQNGFLYDYFKFLPGPDISNFETFLKELSSLSKGTDNYQDKRHDLRKLIHKYKDGEFSKRIYELIDFIK